MKNDLNGIWPQYDPGQFRHVVTLLSQVIGSDGAGSNVSYVASTPPVTAWMKIEYLRGSEVVKSGLDVSDTYLKCTGWFNPAFSAQQRVQTPAGNQFIIQSVENVQEINTYMVLMCLGVSLND